MPIRSLAIIALVIMGIFALVWRQTHVEPMKVSGVVEADEIRVGSRVGGRVREVLVEEGQHVEPNQVMVRLDPFDLEDRLAEAMSGWAAAREACAKLNAGFRVEEIAAAVAVQDAAKAQYDEAVAGPRPQEIEQARKNVTLADEEFKLAKAEFDRTDKLRKARSVSPEEFDNILTRLNVTRAMFEVRQSQLTLLVEGTRKEQVARAKAELDAAEAEAQLRRNGYRKEEIAQAKAQAESAEAMVRVIKKQLAELDIHAPTAAVVEAIDIRPGDLIAPNAPVVSLMDARALWVRAYVPENRLGWVHPEKGERTVDVGIDSFPDERFRGRVIFVSRQAEFTPSNVQTPEERSKQVFRIKVELIEGGDRLRPGMAADVYLTDPGTN